METPEVQEFINPKYLIQILLGRDSDRDVLFLDLTAWTHFDPMDLGNTITESVLLCPECKGPTNQGMCAKCGVLTDLEDAGEGMAVSGSHSFVSRTVAEIYESFNFDADILLIFLPKGVESCMDLRGISIRPMEEVFALGEMRFYTRNALHKDCLGGISLRKAIEGFLNA